LEFQADTGSGFGAWAALTGANLSGLGAFPAGGIKLKLRITTTTTNTTAISSLYLLTNTTTTAMDAGLYPLDTISLTITGLQTMSDVVILAAGTETVRASVDDNPGTSFVYTYSTIEPVDIAVYKPGYIPYFIRGYSLGSSNASLPVAQVVDRGYLV
jgi:hypothetical protein